MTKSIQKRQKQLRKKAKPHDCHAQSPSYWRKEMRRRDKEKDLSKDFSGIESGNTVI